MRIAIWHNLPSGGGKRALYYHVKGLVERGHDLEAWCPSTADNTYLPLSDLIKENIIPFNEIKTSDIIFNDFFIPYKTIINRLEAMDRHCRQCAEEINRKNFDLLFVNACMFFRTSAIAQYVNIPTLIYLGEPYRWLYEALPELPWLAISPPTTDWYYSLKYIKHFVKNLIEVQGLRVQMREELRYAKAFDLILVNSLFSRESLKRAYNLESKVCYLGVDCNTFRHLSLSRKNIVVGLGAIYNGKGLERAIYSIGTIEKFCRPSLVWVGNFSDHVYEENIKKLAASLEVEFVSKVKISDSDLVQILNQASVMIYTSILEPFGLAPLEANACGTPVVAIAEGGVRESIKDGVNGFLINSYDPFEIGKVIQKILVNEEFANQLGKQAKDYVSEAWSLDSAISNLEAYFLDLLKK